MENPAIQLLRQRFSPQEGTVPHDAFDYIHEFGRAVMALLHSPLFLPDFAEVEGRVVVTSRFPRVDGHQPPDAGNPDLLGDGAWTEVGYLFADRSSSDEEDRMLAELMAEAWRGRLAYLFPGRKFVVRVLEPEETGDSIGVEFEEIR
ncbi:MAG: hypothetical protein ABJL17_00990 [Parvibaculum sp.]|uniref:hypothetical protein n=1 Tax=Parvibaculum sp. TaxID=2024848 RepID=UPI003264FAE6